ncbi:MULTISPECIES: trypsin-like peptidase domain-containing protein [unclassified Streptomyces]|uniref:S1C family serine protease n=1 Tax=unclassified Streptomyces TaxID=2593676 RepID=UPI002E0DC5A5|nr:trypsin-like peptidase domain-containing protein [Streptomyces sp. NBC_01197]WSS50347.1 trypsin-like peptidase domain-containing protein [Streptomyces sp. NBC_01180]
MSTENEGTEGTAAETAPPAPSAPPVPVAAPEGTPASATEATAQLPGPVPADAPEPARAADAGWPPPPPSVPAYGGGGNGGYGEGGGPVWGAPVPAPPAGPKKRAGGLIAAVVVAALVAGGIGGGIGYFAAEHSDNATGSTTVSAPGKAQEVKRSPNTVAGIAAKALPSVVTIEAKSGNGDGGTGTGFIYDTQGHILTNNHVVAEAADGGTLTATFSNGKKYDAEVVGRAQGYDVAVVKLKNAPSGLTPLELGNSDQVAVGDSTIAIGAPFGLSNTVTTGIVSAKNRPVASGDGSGSKASYMSALQTDASINPGNSGGPLLDDRGAVIGINSAIQSASSGSLGGDSQAGSIGLGFAIPISQAKNVAQQLIKTGQPVYPVIGATVAMDEQGNGAKISDQGASGTASVAANGPAAKAGLKPGDVITKLDGTAIDSGPTLIGTIWTHKPGDKVQLTYKRGGKEHTVEVTLGQRKGDS